MSNIELFFPVCVQPHITKCAFEHLCKYTDLKEVKLKIILNNACREAEEYFSELENKEQFEIIRYEARFSLGRILNDQLANTKTDLFGIVHNDTFVSPNWLQHLKAIYEDFIGEANLLNGKKYPMELVELAGVSPYTNNNEHHFLIYQDMAQRFDEVKPPTKTPITKEILDKLFEETYPKGYEDFTKNLVKSSDSWYCFVPEVSSFCTLINTSAFKRVCKVFDERFVGAGGEIRAMCLKLKQAGYLFARANRCYVHHHGNLTNDGVDCDYSIQLAYNQKLLERVEAGNA